MHLPIYGTTSGEKREEEDGDRHLFRSNFSQTNQNIKIVVKSLCHKIRRHWKGLGSSQVVLVVENLPASIGDTEDAGLIPRLGRCPGGGNGNLLIFSTGKYHEEKILAGYSPSWGCKEADATQQAHKQACMKRTWCLNSLYSSYYSDLLTCLIFLLQLGAPHSAELVPGSFGCL